MAENEPKNDRRFRLPKLFSDESDSKSKAEAVAERANALGISLPAAAPDDVIARANRAFETAPRAVVLPASEMPVEGAASEDATQAVAETPAAIASEEIEEVVERIDELHALLAEINDRGLAQDKVFNTLHNELQDYKNDFIYEHLKPVLRPLLFLYDSMEQFDAEMETVEGKMEPDEKCTGAPPAEVRENVRFFREQLIEALRICEAVPMQTPEGVYDPRLHKPITTVPVERGQEGVVQRVIRGGWFLNGRVFRPAEVVVGKASPHMSKDAEAGS